jgi:hypothetical protein
MLGQLSHLQSLEIKVDSLALRLKLQSSAAKAQGKTIDFDLKRLQVAQLAEHLDIVKRQC